MGWNGSAISRHRPSQPIETETLSTDPWYVGVEPKLRAAPVELGGPRAARSFLTARTLRASMPIRDNRNIGPAAVLTRASRLPGGTLLCCGSVWGRAIRL